MKGIGYEVAKYMVNHGAHVILACRNDERGKKAEQSINQQVKMNSIYKGGKAEYINCDLSSLESTKKFIQTYKNKTYPLHTLINNAGMAGTRGKLKFTKDDIDMIWQINYLSHFLITYELLPVMIESCKDNKFDCRILNTSSLWHDKGIIDFDILMSDKQAQIKAFRGTREHYGDSKLAQILHATYMQTEIFTPLNIPISTASVNPGGVRTNIFGTQKWKIHMKLVFYFFYPAWLYGLRSPEQGSRNNIYCAIAPIGKRESEWGGEFVPGAYHTDMKPEITRDVKAQSTDPKAMRRLYQLSLDMLSLTKRTKKDYQQMINDEKQYYGAITDEKEDDDEIDYEELKDGLIVLTDKEYLFYSITDCNWKRISELNDEQRCFDGPSILFDDDTIYRIGGRNIKSDATMIHCEYFKLKREKKFKSWVTMKGKLNEKRCSGSSIFLDEHLLMIGGDSNGDELATIEEYDFDEMKWKLRSRMNETRNDFGVCTISNNELLVFGGHSVDEQSGIFGYLDSIEKYNYNLDKWITLNTKMPSGKRARCGAFHWKQYKPNSIIIAGGTSPCRNVVECLDLEKMKWTQYPNLNNCHWWSKIGTISIEQPQILYVVGLNEQNKLDVVEYLDVRENTKKWNTQNIIHHTNDKISAICWV